VSATIPATAWPSVPDATGPAAEQAVLDRVPTGLLVDGVWQPAAGDATFAVVDPATGETLLRIADASPEDGRKALDAAVAARHSWAATCCAARSTCCRSDARSSRS
jgi:succinate-semialdehyde dehydrogenase/glutarate-semialdehyde dehydrogenase